MKNLMLLVAAAIVGGAWWWTRPGSDPTTGETDNAPDIADYTNTVFESAQDMVTISTDTATANSNLGAFLMAIRAKETGPDDSAYATLCGGGLFADYGDHPALLGWRGLPLSDSMCAGAGFGTGCVSTAAGAYQITKPTWLRLKSKLGLSDFSPASQDAAAVELIREKGALDDANAGRVASAVGKVRKVWASLPGAGYGQGETTLAAFTNQFTNNGGVLA